MDPKIARALRAAHPPQQRVYPTPPFAPSDSFRDDIFIEPKDPATKTLDFDKMDLRERGWYPTSPAAPDRKPYADGGETKSWYDTISEYTQPIRDFSDRTGNTEFWRGVMANPGLALAAQFVGRAPVRGTPAYDQAMMRVLDRRAGGPAFTADRLRATMPEDAASLGQNARRLPPVRDIDLSEIRGLTDARYPTAAGSYRPHAWQTHMSKATNNIEPMTPYDRAAMDRAIRRQNIRSVD